MMIDILLCIMLLIVLGSLFFVKRVEDGIVLFLFIGLVMCLIWLRLDAIDVALVEAIVGTALLTAVMLTLLQSHAVNESESGKPLPSLLLYLSLGGAGAWLMYQIFLQAETALGEAGVLTFERLDESGIEAAVTAVLLNFRGYDTLLEIVVLYLGWMCVSVLSKDPHTEFLYRIPASFMRARLALVVVPVSLFAFYILFQGFTSHGGAFHAGAMLAGAAMLLVVSEQNVQHRWLQRIAPLLWLGFGVFIALGISGHLVEGTFLNYPKSMQSDLIFFLELVLTFSIGVLLFKTFRLFYQMDYGPKASDTPETTA